MTIELSEVSQPGALGARGAARQQHILALDGVRAIAVLLVLLHHYGTGFTGWALKVVDGAWVGVDLFFVLSGFLITGILLEAKGAPHYFRNFYARRTIRIFPLYYAVLLVCVGAAGFVPSIRGIWRLQGWLWLYGTNIKIALADGWVFRFGGLELNHFWSLAVEEHFYLVWPAVVLLLSPRGLLRVCIILIGAALACRVALDYRFHFIASHVLTPCRIDLLASGAVVAILARSKEGVALLRAWVPWIFWASIGVAGLLIIRARGGFPNMMRVGVVYYDALAGIFSALVWFAATVEPVSFWGRVLGSRPLVALGRWSYGIYVYHVIVLGFIPRSLHPVAFLLVGVAISILVAAVSWAVFEKPVLRLKRFFPRAG